jgi:oligopeptide/dipeptide ABC transporter ATP-binding protein
VTDPVLRVEEVDVVYRRSGLGRSRAVRALSGASLSVDPGEVVAVIGESGSGKSTLARAIVGLVPVSAGRISLEGKDIVSCSARERRQRLRGVQMVFQNPYASLSPHLRVKDIVAEPLDIWERHPDPAGRTEEVRQVLAKVGIDPERAEEKTVTFSGGQRQRIALARALIGGPRLLICDEVLSALDVSTQAQLLGVLNELKRQEHFAMLIISHNLAVLRYIADRVVVMYAGVIVETGSANQIVDAPQHPYTRALVAAAQAVDVGAPVIGLTDRTGEAPDPTDLPRGCVYQSSCPERTDICGGSRPEAVVVDAGALVRCFHRQPVSLPGRSAASEEVKVGP